MLTNTAFDLLFQLGMIVKEVRCVLTALANSLAIVGIPRTGLFDHILLNTQLQNLAGSVNTLTVKNLEFSLTKWRGYFVLHHFHPSLVAHNLVAIFHRTDSANIQSHRRVKLQCITTGCRFWGAEHHTNFHSDLVDKDHQGV